MIKAILKWLWLDKPRQPQAGDIRLYGSNDELSVSIGRYVDHTKGARR